MKLNIGGITEAGLSKKNRTGDWSYFIPGIDGNICNGCGICELFCPENCIDIIEGLCVVNDYFCKGCGICARECKRGAIKMEIKGGTR